MFYKNAKFYKVTEELDLTDLTNKLSRFKARDCGAQEVATFGFDNVIGECLTHECSGNVLFSLRKQEKILPSSVVNKALGEIVAKIEEETGETLGKIRRRDLKDGIINRMLPQAFTKDTHTFGAYCKNSGLIIIDSASDTKAETFLAMLRKALGSLPVVPLFNHSISYALTDWIVNPPNQYTILEKARLQSTDQGAPTVTVTNQNLSSDEVSVHMQSGKMVTQLAIDFDETLSCVIQSDGTIKSIKFSDLTIEQNDDIPRWEHLARFDADITLSLGEINRFTNSLVKALDIQELD